VVPYWQKPLWPLIAPPGWPSGLADSGEPGRVLFTTFNAQPRHRRIRSKPSPSLRATEALQRSR